MAWPVPAHAVLMAAEVPQADPARLGADTPGGWLLDRPFGAETLDLLRAAVLAHARAAGVSKDLAIDVMLAAHELAANAVRHGAGTGRLRMEAGLGTLRVEVHDAGGASRDRPAGSGSLDGQWPYQRDHGLGLVRQVAGQLSVASGPEGSVVTAVFPLTDQDGSRMDDCAE